MKKTTLSVKMVRLIWLMVLLCFLICLCPISTQAATKKITFTNIDQYAELEALTPFTIRWSATGGTVTGYTFSLRYLYNKEDYKNILIYNKVSVPVSDASYRMPGDILSPHGLYRYSVSAVIGGTTVWSEDRYFYVSSHGPLTSTLNFHIYNGFETATKNAAYYATQAWSNALGYSRADTYAFSNGTDDIGTDDDGNALEWANGRNVISVGWFDWNETFVARTYTYDVAGIIYEKDIFLNKSRVGFANSAQPGKCDVQSVLTHELGHVYGLTDKYEVGGYGGWATDWTMFGVAEKNSIAFRSLTSYDEAHLHSIYD